MYIGTWTDSSEFIFAGVEAAHGRVFGRARTPTQKLVAKVRESFPGVP